MQFYTITAEISWILVRLTKIVWRNYVYPRNVNFMILHVDFHYTYLLVLRLKMCPNM